MPSGTRKRTRVSSSPAQLDGRHAACPVLQQPSQFRRMSGAANGRRGMS